MEFTILKVSVYFFVFFLIKYIHSIFNKTDPKVKKIEFFFSINMINIHGYCSDGLSSLILRLFMNSSVILDWLLDLIILTVEMVR